MIRKCVLFAFVIIPLVGYAQRDTSDKKVIFRVLSKPTSFAAKVHITGNHPQLGDWQYPYVHFGGSLAFVGNPMRKVADSRLIHARMTALEGHEHSVKQPKNLGAFASWREHKRFGRLSRTPQRRIEFRYGKRLADYEYYP